MGSVLLEARPFRPFKSSEEYLIAMKEDLAEWLQTMYPHLNIHVENFMEKLETGVALCEHANAVKHQAMEYVEKKQAKKVMTRSITGSLAQAQSLIKLADVKYFSTAKPGTFFARDNVSNFIRWCRVSLEIIECLLFESDDLIMRKNEKHVILCLLEVARRGAKFGMLAPMLVQMERQIDREIAADQRKLETMNEGIEAQTEADDSDSDMDDEEPVLMYGPIPQIVTNDLKSLDEMVRDLVEKCTCPTQFPMIRVSEGKYRIGDTKVLIFVRILRNHVMVRVGGGWDTLSHYLDKHDPCRCKSQHRTTQGARLVNKPGAPDLHGSHVYYERLPMQSTIYNNNNNTNNFNGSLNPNCLGPPMNSLNRSRSRSPSHLNDRRSISPNFPRKSLAPPPPSSSSQSQSQRSRSPTPNYNSTLLTKLSSNSSTKSKSLNSSPTHNNHQNHRQLSPNRSNQKNNKNSHITSIQIPVENKVLKSEASLQVTDPMTDHSDTTSEMSDEGYRSLGLIQDKNKQRSSLYSQNSVEDADDNEHCIEDDLNDFGLRKTQFSQRIYENTPKPQSQDPFISSSSPKKEPCFVRAHSHEEKTNKPPPPATTTPTTTPKKQSKINTWNGRQKAHRASITTDTFQMPFVRNSPTRRSVSAVCERRSSSATTSPTKGRLRQEILNAVKQNNDEALIVQQVQELLKKYGSMTMLDDDYTFTRGGERMSFRSPRKDSRPENNISRIPAPVPHKV